MMINEPAKMTGDYSSRFSWCVALCAAISAAIFLPLCAEAVQIDASRFERSFSITFPGYSGSETLTDFPVLIRLSPGLNDFRYSVCKVANGGDVRFADADGNLLACEVDTWDPSGESLVWVKVPSLSSSTEIRAYYGCANPPENNPKEVWSNGYVGVWHLGESARPLVDSTPHGLNFTKSHGDAGKEGYYDDRIAFATNGMVGAGVAFDMNADHKGMLLAPDDNHFSDGLGEITIELWTNRRGDADNNKNRHLMTKYGGDGSHFAYQITQQYSDQRLASQFKDEDGTNISVNPNSHGVTPIGEWCHNAYVCTVTAGTGNMYVNGVSRINNSSGSTTKPLMSVDAPISLGNRGDNTASYAFPGIVDELRISSVSRSSDWVKATYDTVASDSFAAYEVDNDWTRYSRKFVVSFPGAPEASLTDFPVLIKLSQTGIKGFSYDGFAKENGGDLRFADENGQLLAHEIDTWNENGVSTVWVKVPTLSSSTKITAYYGWVFAPVVNSKQVWSNGYLGVWHLNESARPLRDSTANGIHFTRSNRYNNGNEYDDCATFGQEDSAVGHAVKFNPNVEGKENKGGLVAPDDDGILCGLDAMTIEIWAKVDAFDTTTSRYMVGRRMGNNTVVDGVTVKYKGYQFEYSSSKRPMATFYLENGQGNDDSKCELKPSAMSTSLAGQWNYHCASYDRHATSHTNYLNAAVAATAVNSTGYAIHGSIPDPLCLANDCQTSSTKVFNGALDELRISNVARSKDWVKATYDTIKNNAAFTAYGAAREQVRGLKIIFR